MYFPHEGSTLGPVGPLYANQPITSTYSVFVRQLVEHSISSVFGTSLYEMRAPGRCCGAVAFARQVGMYLAHVAGGLSLSEVGRLFGRDRTTVAHACGVIEDGRDDPLLDRLLTVLELALGASLQLSGNTERGAR
jgi:Bacterial dnaA protein helix-turn-helix